MHAPSTLLPPCGGKLVDLLISDEAERSDWIAHAARLPSLQLLRRSLCDLELLTVGDFSPLDRFMSEDDYRRVLAEMRLGDGTLLPIPITLPVPENVDLCIGDWVALRSPTNELLAVMQVAERFA